MSALPIPAPAPASRNFRKPPGYERLPDHIQRWKRPGELRLERPQLYALGAVIRSAVLHKNIELIESETGSHPERPEFAKLSLQRFHDFVGRSVTRRAVEIQLQEGEQRGFIEREFPERKRYKGGFRINWERLLGSPDAEPRKKEPKTISDVDAKDPKSISDVAVARNRKPFRMFPTSDALGSAMQCAHATGCPLLVYAVGTQSVVVATGRGVTPVQGVTTDGPGDGGSPINTNTPVDGHGLGYVPDSTSDAGNSYLADIPHTYSAPSTTRVFSSEFHLLPDRTGGLSHTSERMGYAVSDAESRGYKVSHASAPVGETVAGPRFTESLVPPATAAAFTHSSPGMGEAVSLDSSTPYGVSHSSGPMGETASAGAGQPTSAFHLLPEATGEASTGETSGAEPAVSSAAGETSSPLHLLPPGTGETLADAGTRLSPSSVPTGETDGDAVSLQQKYRSGEIHEGTPTSARGGGVLANYRKMGKKSGGVYREKIAEENRTVANPLLAKTDKTPSDLSPAEFAERIGRVFHLGGKAIPSEKQAGAAAAKLASRAERREAFADWADREKLATGAVRRAWGPGVLLDWVSEFFVFQGVSKKIEAEAAEAERAAAEESERRYADLEAGSEREAPTTKPQPAPAVCQKCRGSGELHNLPDPDDYTPCTCAIGQALKVARANRHAGES
jgi:hypothetical protein